MTTNNNSLDIHCVIMNGQA